MFRMPATKLLVATRNPGKLREIRAMLPEYADRIVGLEAFPGLTLPAETGTTLVENATMKARSAAELTGLAVLADDSGLEVDALKGRPGVHSAIFAGEGAGDEANNRLLLDLLAQVPDAQRSARFVCVIALWKGQRGASGGGGPVPWPDLAFPVRLWRIWL